MCRRCYKNNHRETHREEAKASVKRWQAENPDTAKALVKKWRDANPERDRELHHERRIYLSEYADCKKFNNIFPGCHAHHIDPDTIMHIPAHLHNTVRHSLKTWHGMWEMNQLSHDRLNSVRRDSPQSTPEAFI